MEDTPKRGEDGRVSVAASHGNKNKNDNHSVRNAVLPGVFFIYEIYPFAVEIRHNTVPFTHLFIRILATVGGVFALFKAADSLMYARVDRVSSR